MPNVAVPIVRGARRQGVASRPEAGPEGGGIADERGSADRRQQQDREKAVSQYHGGHRLLLHEQLSSLERRSAEKAPPPRLE
jgi:hypothetical protein